MLSCITGCERVFVLMCRPREQLRAKYSLTQVNHPKQCPLFPDLDSLRRRKR